MKYDVHLSVMIQPADENGRRDPGMLSFSRRFEFTGDSFSAIAARIDALYAAIEKGLEHDPV